MYRITPIVKNLIIINVAVFIIFYLYFGNNEEAYHFLTQHSTFSDLFKPHQIITHMFMHADLSHLFFNMFGLFIFGPLLENFIGQKRFLFFYLGCGLGASLLTLGWDYIVIRDIIADIELFYSDPDPTLLSVIINDHGYPGAYRENIEFIEEFLENPASEQLIASGKDLIQRAVIIPQHLKSSLGASGAVLGVLAGTALYFPNTQMFLLFIPFPIKLKYLAIFYAVMEYFAVLKPQPGDNTGHLAHLGGMLTGVIIVLIWKKQRNKFY